MLNESVSVAAREFTRGSLAATVTIRKSRRVIPYQADFGALARLQYDRPMRRLERRASLLQNSGHRFRKPAQLCERTNRSRFMAASG